MVFPGQCLYTSPISKSSKYLPNRLASPTHLSLSQRPLTEGESVRDGGQGTGAAATPIRPVVILSFSCVAHDPVTACHFVVVYSRKMTKRQGKRWPGGYREIRGDRSPAVKDLILDLAAQGPVASSDVTSRTGLTRQAILYHLNQMVDAGELIRVGRGRGTHYLLKADFSETFQLAGLEEHEVWKIVEAQVQFVQTLKPNVRSILAYAFTEMLNNAIEHSKGTRVRVRFWREESNVLFEVADNGRGVFRTVRETFGLEDDFAAIQHLAKGKQTSDPTRHSGEGIFFTSKAVDRFQLESNALKWIVDNIRDDQAIGDSLVTEGTGVRCTIHRNSARVLKDVFDAYSDPETYEFAKSSVKVRLSERGQVFLSRSEAKRLLAGLDAFRQVVIDFSGVNEIGQGFADEVFRVWNREHPETSLVPANMSPAIAEMVRRGIRN
ncbi:MAG: DUF4325 domain-containing protein [Actinobacteria bacterium]|nr:MAG: DUF4325 domain-containing protein [Actinomycetota bacterium]